MNLRLLTTANKLYNTTSDAVTSLRGQQNQGLQRGMARGPAGQDGGVGGIWAPR